MAIFLGASDGQAHPINDWLTDLRCVGGLTVHLGLLKANFFLSFVAAAIGIFVPIGLCFALLYVGFGYEPVETFIISAALSVTSLGTTFVVIGSVAKGIDFAKTKVGTVLISAAVVSDVSGLIMARYLQTPLFAVDVRPGHDHLFLS